MSLYQLHGWRDRSCDNTLHWTGGRHDHFLWKTIKTTRRFGGRNILHLFGDAVYDTGRWWNICLSEAATKAWKGLVYLAFDIPAPALPGFSCPSLQLPVLYWRFGSRMVGIVHKHILQCGSETSRFRISNGWREFNQYKRFHSLQDITFPFLNLGQLNINEGFQDFWTTEIFEAGEV